MKPLKVRTPFSCQSQNIFADHHASECRMCSTEIFYYTLGLRAIPLVPESQMFQSESSKTGLSRVAMHKVALIIRDGDIGGRDGVAK